MADTAAIPDSPDAGLRACGFVVHRRRRGQPTQWRLVDTVFDEAKAIRFCRELAALANEMISGWRNG